MLWQIQSLQLNHTVSRELMLWQIQSLQLNHTVSREPLLWQILCIPYLDSSSSKRRLTPAALHSLSSLERGSVRTSLYSDCGSCWISISPPACTKHSHKGYKYYFVVIMQPKKCESSYFIMWGLNNIYIYIYTYIYMYKPTEEQKCSFLCELFLKVKKSYWWRHSDHRISLCFCCYIITSQNTILSIIFNVLLSQTSNLFQSPLGQQSSYPGECFNIAIYFLGI